MSFFLENYLSIQKSTIKPLHNGFGFGADEIQQRLGKANLGEKELVTKAIVVEKEILVSYKTSTTPTEIEVPQAPQVPQKPITSKVSIKSSSRKSLEFDEEAKEHGIGISGRIATISLCRTIGAPPRVFP